MMSEKEKTDFEKLVATAKTLQYYIVDYLLESCVFDKTGNITDSLSEAEWGIIDSAMETLSLVLGLQEQWKDLIDDIPMDMQKVGENYEVYSVGTKKQWVDWLVRCNKILVLRELYYSKKEATNNGVI